MTEPLLSVLIPVYNEESTIGDVIDRVVAVPVNKEIVIVDDGSTDRTAEILRAKSAAIRHTHDSRVNAGKGFAVRVALTYAEGNVVIIQDADLELDPAEYPQLLQPILEGHADAVFGSRFAPRGWRPSGERPRLRSRLANAVMTAAMNLIYGTRLTDVLTAYKAMRGDIARGIRLECRGFEFDVEVAAKLARLGYRIVEVPISYRPRTESEGKKVRWHHAIPMMWTLVRYRFAAERRLLNGASARVPSPTRDATPGGGAK